MGFGDFGDNPIFRQTHMRKYLSVYCTSYIIYLYIHVYIYIYSKEFECPIERKATSEKYERRSQNLVSLVIGNCLDYPTSSRMWVTMGIAIDPQNRYYFVFQWTIQSKISTLPAPLSIWCQWHGSHITITVTCLDRIGLVLTWLHGRYGAIAVDSVCNLTPTWKWRLNWLATLNIIFKYLLKHLLNWFEHVWTSSLSIFIDFHVPTPGWIMSNAESHLCRRHSP